MIFDWYTFAVGGLRNEPFLANFGELQAGLWML